MHAGSDTRFIYVEIPSLALGRVSEAVSSAFGGPWQRNAPHCGGGVRIRGPMRCRSPKDTSAKGSKTATNPCQDWLGRRSGVIGNCPFYIYAMPLGTYIERRWCPTRSSTAGRSRISPHQFRVSLGCAVDSRSTILEGLATRRVRRIVSSNT